MVLAVGQHQDISHDVPEDLAFAEEEIGARSSSSHLEREPDLVPTFDGVNQRVASNSDSNSNSNSHGSQGYGSSAGYGNAGFGHGHFGGYGGPIGYGLPYGGYGPIPFGGLHYGAGYGYGLVFTDMVSHMVVMEDPRTEGMVVTVTAPTQGDMEGGTIEGIRYSKVPYSIQDLES